MRCPQLESGDGLVGYVALGKSPAHSCYEGLSSGPFLPHFLVLELEGRGAVSRMGVGGDEVEPFEQPEGATTGIALPAFTKLNSPCIHFNILTS